MTWTSPPRHQPPDLTAFTRPRLVWPRHVIEIDQLPHAA